MVLSRKLSVTVFYAILLIFEYKPRYYPAKVRSNNIVRRLRAAWQKLIQFHFMDKHDKNRRKALIYERQQEVISAAISVSLLVKGTEFTEASQIHNPTWQNIEAAILELISSPFDTVILEIYENERDLQLVVKIIEGFYQISVEISHFVTQETETFHLNEFVELEVTLKAANTFAKLGELDASLSWRNS